MYGLLAYARLLFFLVSSFSTPLWKVSQCTNKLNFQPSLLTHTHACSDSSVLTHIPTHSHVYSPALIRAQNLFYAHLPAPRNAQTHVYSCSPAFTDVHTHVHSHLLTVTRIHILTSTYNHRQWLSFVLMLTGIHSCTYSHLYLHPLTFFLHSLTDALSQARELSVDWVWARGWGGMLWSEYANLWQQVKWYYIVRLTIWLRSTVIIGSKCWQLPVCIDYWLAVHCLSFFQWLLFHLLTFKVITRCKACLHISELSWLLSMLLPNLVQLDCRRDGNSVVHSGRHASTSNYAGIFDNRRMYLSLSFCLSVTSFRAQVHPN